MSAQPNDPSAIRTQLEALHTESFAWALACCAANPAEAEDVLQMTYLKILDGRAPYEGRSTFKTWLFGVIRLTAREQRRRTWLRWLRRAPAEDAAERPSEDPAPDDAAARRDVIARVQEACGWLPVRQREVLMLVFHHELTLDEAAAAMRVSPGSARKHYQRGKEQLRARLCRIFSKP